MKPDEEDGVGQWMGNQEPPMMRMKGRTNKNKEVEKWVNRKLQSEIWKLRSQRWSISGK